MEGLSVGAFWRSAYALADSFLHREVDERSIDSHPVAFSNGYPTGRQFELAISRHTSGTRMADYYVT